MQKQFDSHQSWHGVKSKQKKIDIAVIKIIFISFLY